MSVSSAIFQPFQCDLHPNGESTMRAYRQVVCWNPAYGDKHRQIETAGVIASLIPLGIVSMCLWATLALPKRLQLGDTIFLNKFAFLFFRFRLSAHWFVLILLMRNMAFALAPVITKPVVELFAFSAVVLLCVVASTSVFPWSVYQANFLDMGTHVGLLQIIFLAAVQTPYALGNMLVVVFCTSMLRFLVDGVWCLQLGNPFQYFLCHHKEGGGAFCRLLKMRLKSHRQTERERRLPRLR